LDRSAGSRLASGRRDDLSNWKGESRIQMVALEIDMLTYVWTVRPASTDEPRT
jgi:hypothetical protein